MAPCACSIGLCESFQYFLFIIYFSWCSTNICVFCWFEYFILSWFWHVTSKIKLQFKAEHNFKSSNFKGWDFAFVIFSYHNFCLKFSVNFSFTRSLKYLIDCNDYVSLIRICYFLFCTILSKHYKLGLICNKSISWSKGNFVCTYLRYLVVKQLYNEWNFEFLCNNVNWKWQTFFFIFFQGLLLRETL